MSHISFHTLHPLIAAKARYALAAMTVLFCVSCSSDDVIEEIKEIDTTGTDLMRFTRAEVVQSENTTRAANYLKTGFMVSCYKGFGQSTQQMVMDKYEVEHRTVGSNWYGTTDAWEYIGVNNQIERYWDLNSYPYRFNAIAPCPSETDVVLSDKALTITKDYLYQTCTDGTVTPADTEAEPYMVAQVQRGTDGKDKDIFAGSDIAGTSTTMTRYVAMPFHHLNSKVRFGVYTENAWATANMVYIEDLVIKVSSSGFVTGASSYQRSNDNDSWKVETGNSGFQGMVNATTETEREIFKFSGRDANHQFLEDNDLRKHQSQSSAYMMECKDGIMQIPQEGVEMKLSLKILRADETIIKTYEDVPIKLILPDQTIQESFNWVSGNIYTYYLILGFTEEKLEITFTSTLAPWEDISGSIETDLEK